MSPRRRWLWPASALLALALASPAQAQFSIPGLPSLVFDPRAVAEAVRGVRQRAEQLIVARRQLDYQIATLRSLRHPNWRHLGLLHRDLAEVVREGEALGYSLERLDREFDRAFPGYAVPANPRAADVERLRRTLATMRASLQAAGLQARDAAHGQETLHRIKDRMEGLEGTQQAIQLHATLTGYTADELSAIRTQLAAQANADAVYRAHELQERMQAQAAWDALVAHTRERPVLAETWDVSLRGRR